MSVVLPSSLDAEKAVLSCMMQVPDQTMVIATDLLGPKDFYFSACELIFGTLTGMYRREEPIDPVSVTVALNAGGLLDKVGGAAFVSECYTASPNAGHLRHYAGQVMEFSRRRKLWHVGME